MRGTSQDHQKVKKLTKNTQAHALYATKHCVPSPDRLESLNEPLVRLGVTVSRGVCKSSGRGSWTRGELGNKPSDRRTQCSEHVCFIIKRSMDVRKVCEANAGQLCWVLASSVTAAYVRDCQLGSQTSSAANAVPASVQHSTTLRKCHGYTYLSFVGVFSHASR